MSLKIGAQYCLQVFKGSSRMPVQYHCHPLTLFGRWSSRQHGTQILILLTPAFGASESESPLTDYEKFGYSRGISKTPYSPLSSPLKLCVKCVVNSFSYDIPSISLVHEQELRKIPMADAQEK